MEQIFGIGRVCHIAFWEPHFGPSMWIPSTFMPALPGKLFYLKELAGPLVADVN